MKDIVIYKSKNNGLGGDIDFTNNSSIFTTENNIRYCCLYIMNNSSNSKRILNISSINLDNILLDVIEDEVGVILNEYTIENNLPELSNYTSARQFTNLVLNSKDFFTVILKLNSTDTISKRSLNISVEYVDEY